ncbi:hypothetical protein DVA86_10040 [Streptomyces armeniacus]|uniref:Uncharacterized protein n=1 Tax=Streptomyces armeniacus TaxID=83291 RepID=A0A345XMS3_9ACTN|nr:hypothetical protein [Streptomyces armeniacus]AXK32939.1 hypothetical protein DVA86_10040 [Streptomyces armeniacus]
MRKNIRRSLVVAAAASGVWLLGAATASADEQPAVPGTGAVTDTVDGARNVTDQLPADAPDAQLPADAQLPSVPSAPSTPETPNLPTVPDTTSDLRSEVDGLQDRLPRTEVVDKVADKPVKKVKPVKRATKAAKDVRKAVRQAVDGGSVLPAVPGLPAAPNAPTVPNAPAVPAHPSVPGTDGLPAAPEAPVVPSVPAAPNTADLITAIGGAGVRPDQVTTLVEGAGTGQLTGTVKTTLATAQPTVDRASESLLPPLARRTVAKVLPVAEQAVADTEVATDNALATTTPFAHGAVTDTAAFTQNITADTVPYAWTLSTGAAYDVRTLADNAVAGTQRVTVVPGAGELTNAASVPALPVAATLPAQF